MVLENMGHKVAQVVQVQVVKSPSHFSLRISAGK